MDSVDNCSEYHFTNYIAMEALIYVNYIAMEALIYVTVQELSFVMLYTTFLTFLENEN